MSSQKHLDFLFQESKKKEFFLNGRPSSLMSFNQQYSGHTNPGYQSFGDDDDQDDGIQENVENEGYGNGVDFKFGNGVDLKTDDSHSNDNKRNDTSRKQRFVIDNLIKRCVGMSV